LINPRIAMSDSSQKLRADALRIWHAGLDAVRSERLMRNAVRIEGRTLILGNDFLGLPEDALRIDLNTVKRIAVVGAGKAGAGMAAALEEILGRALLDEKQLTGWVNVPADCIPQHPHLATASRLRRPGPLPEGEGDRRRIHLHAARPAGVNEPTEVGVAGAQEILRLVESLGPDDLCIALISGGGSALLPAPIAGISLADKLAVTKFLSAAGANIAELNTVRKQLSRIKGGGLARARRAGRLVSLIISDIPGDPLDLIASGPTVPDDSTPQAALAVLERFGARTSGVPASVFTALEKKQAENGDRSRPLQSTKNFIIGNNDMAVAAAKREAEQLGYSTYASCAAEPEGAVEKIGQKLAQAAQSLLQNEKSCLLSGGEGTVKLAPSDERGLGGRNQQTVLAALIELTKQTQDKKSPQIVILSCGTDGEDGPTDAAGAFVDWAVIEEARRRGLNAEDYLRRNDAYHFFEPLGALIKTGPTNTNVCDLRVVIVGLDSDRWHSKTASC
jgi:glycerate 2-kinase